MKRAMILAAGRGERMGKLTETTPKCLLNVGGKYLIDYAIASMKQAGIEEIIMNISWQAEKIKQALGNGEKYGIKIIYSEEPERLETGGGIFKALPLLGENPFIVMSSDIITDFPLNQLPQKPQGLAHIILVKNPHYHPAGDYGLDQKKILLKASQTFTHGNIGVYRPELFANCHPEHFRLTKVLNPAIEIGKVTGEIYQGKWHNVGTPEDIKLI